MSNTPTATAEKHCVIILSGGLDSSTLVAMAKAEGYIIHALTIDYGQHHRVELEAAKRIAAAFDIGDHRIMQLDLRAFGGSALTDDIAVPKGRDAETMAQDIPVTYVPARNTIFLSLALALAEVTKSDAIFIGVNALDYSGYPDCRPEFIQAYERMAQLATKAGVSGEPAIHVRTPLLHMTKADIIKSGSKLGVDYSLTISCYDPDENGLACGQCDSCLLRAKGFADAGLPDPTPYQPGARPELI